MKKLVFVLVTFVLVFLFIQIEADAQCAMCKQNAKNASKENPGFGEGLNSGIVYLMGIPYGLLVIGGFVFYKSLKKGEEEKEKEREEKEDDIENEKDS